MEELNIVKLQTPLTAECVRQLKAGDIVTLDGDVFIFRDRPHRQVYDYLQNGQQQQIPFDLTGQVIFHTGPIMEKTADGWKVVIVGSTTSIKLEALEPTIIRHYKTRGVIGKGGMGPDTTEAMKEVGCVYFAQVGGAAALLTEGVKEVVEVFWLEENSITEAVWHLKVKDFGPFIVAIDSHGRNLYIENENKVKKKLLEGV